MGFIKEFINELKGIVFVKKCVACMKLLPYDYEGYLCFDCENEWNDSKFEICPTCKNEQIKCNCTRGKQYVDSVRNLAMYTHTEHDSVTNRLIYSMKRSNNDDVFVFLASELEKYILPKKPLHNTVVVSVPRIPVSIRRYGYDHANVLAKKVASILDIAYVDIMRHKGGKVEQKALNSLQREINARKNCVVREKYIPKIKGKNILLIDDIITTGAMTGACAELLKKNGAKRVDCILVAKNRFNQKNYSLY